MNMEYTVSIIKDIQEARNLWNALTPDVSMYDNWDFRFLAYNLSPYELYFYVASSDMQPVAVLPLQFNSDKGYLEFFGGGIMENNQVFYKSGHEEVIPQFYNAIDKKAKLEYIIGHDNYTKSLPFLENKYILDLTKFKDFEEYFETSFQGKTRANFRKKLRNIDELQLEIIRNQFSDIEKLIELNITNFTQKGETSSFLFPFRQDLYRLFPTLQEVTPLLYSFMNSDQKIGIALNFEYNHYFLFLNAGIENSRIPNLGTYIYFYLIEEAFKRGAKIFDAGSDSCNWKERFHLTPIPQYIFEKF